MNSSRGQQEQIDNSAIKDPKDWKSGDDPATASQISYIETLGEQADESTDIDPDNLTKAEASEKIDELREKAGLG